MIFFVFVLTFILTICTAVSATERTVGPGYEFNNITDAINAASPGDTISVYDDNGKSYTYIENVVVNKTALNIISKGKVTVNAKDPDSSVFSIDPNGNECIISNFNITGATNAAGIFFGGASHIIIQNNNISNNNFGIRIPIGNSRNRIFNNTISNNQEGIYVNDESFTTIYGNLIRGNGIEDTGCGINSQGSYRLNITSNTIIENPTGIHHDGSQLTTISSNVLRENHFIGIELFSTSYCQIISNSIRYSDDGIVISTLDINYPSENNIVNGNNISRCGHGLIVNYSKNNTIQDNILNANEIGIATYTSSRNIIRDNILSNNNEGIYSTSEAVIEGNEVFRNTITGNSIGIGFSGAFNNYVYNNTIDKSNIAGISIESSINNIIQYNSINGFLTTGNTLWGIIISNSIGSNVILYNNVSECIEGIYLNNSSNGTINVNNIFKNSYNGITLTNSSYNGIYYNIITRNLHGIDILSSSIKNEIYYNFFMNQNNLNGWDSDNIFNLTPVGGNFWADYLGIDANNDEFGDTPYWGDKQPLVSFGTIWNVGGGSIQSAIDTASPGDTIAVHGYGNPITYTENIIIDKPIILRIDWDGDVTINALNPDLPAITVTKNAEGTIIQGFIITNCSSSGILVDNSTWNFLKSNSIMGQLSSANTLFGICLVNCGEINSGNYILNNTVTYCQEGINLYNVKETIISGNSVTDSIYDGVALNLSTGNTITGNNGITRNVSGIRLIEGSNNNLIKDNNLTGNIWTSISLVSSQLNQITGNILSNCQEGMYLYNSNNNTLSNNTANGNIWDGIAIHDSSNNTIQNNLNLTSNNCGIRVVGTSTGNKIYNNTINGNLWSNISIDAATNNQIYNNTLNSAKVGLYLQGASNNTIYNNTIANNTWDGIDILSGSNNNSVHNNAISGSYYGERILSSTNNTSYMNNFINNSVQAFDDSINNWDNGTTGNYWSDWTTTNPRTIDGGSNKDNHPSTTPF